MPAFEGGDAFVGEAVLFVPGSGLEAGDPVWGIVEMGFDGLMEETVDQFAQGEFGFEMFAALTDGATRFDGADGAEKAEPVAGGTAADLEAFGDVIEAEGFFIGEQQPINQPNRPLSTKGHSKIRE